MNSPSSSNSWIGRALGDNNRYRLDKLLGGGGMGDVFLAMDTRIGKLVALKLLKDTLVASKEMRRRFEREIEICAALDSEHIVQVTDCGVTTEGYPFYIMEYLRGQSLRQMLLREKRLSVERTINIMTQVCQGLQHAHKGVNIERQGGNERIQVVHRDLKPDNIFLENTDSGEFAKIVDFGIAKIRSESFDQTNLTSAFLGTFRYASPEQLRGVIDIDGRADIYSLGIILYETLSGADPFGFSVKERNYSEASWIFAHTSEPPKPLRSQPSCENLPAQLEDVVMRCLQKKPENRFASVEELNLALQVVLASMQKISSATIIEETIYQPQHFLKGSNEETIVRPINVEEKIEKKVQKEETIAQIPPGEKQREETIAQFPPMQSLISENQREETIAQIPIQAQKEETIAQTPPISSANLQLKHEERNFQSPVIKNNVGEHPGERIVQKPNNSSLTVVISIIAFAIACVAGFFAYPLVTSGQTLNKIKEAQNKSNYEECIALSDKVSSDSSIHSEVQQILNTCRQDYAIKLAKEGKCLEAYQVNDRSPKSLFEQIKSQIDNICEIPGKTEASGETPVQKPGRF
ncbi:serine/threonine-protein kinase [Brunnivagina elsteri]|uniref:Serine/threonine protein kinase n=1 Tax=Brunnivagina elsteri CCALA 953 TaxID=987040 RepID=A0A2A2TJ48_9CYAN|nr:serine/threonine-protein kinase [Calothrix elsteri]PAX54544.1 serine/threonine protein kinase [Calothrix elsteri CCALA 953]